MIAAPPPTLLLVHGACHGAWCWDRVGPLLRQAGHTVIAPDLPGRPGTGKPGWRWTLADYADAIVAVARQAGGPVVAIGHSMGGPVISAAAEAAPELFARLIYLSAFLPRTGDSLASIAAEDTDSDLHGAAHMSWLRGVVTIKADRLRPVYYGDCGDAEIDWVRTRLVPESVRPSLAKARLSDRFQSVPRAYIRCTQDRGLSVQMQDRMIERQPCDRVATLGASHSAFVSMPDQCAAALLSVI